MGEGKSGINKKLSKIGMLLENGKTGRYLCIEYAMSKAPFQRTRENILVWEYSE